MRAVAVSPPSQDRVQGDCWPISQSLCIGNQKGLLTVEPGGLVCPTRQTASRCVLEPPCTAEPPMHEGQEESCDTGLTPAWPYLHGVFGPNETTRPSRRLIRDRGHPAGDAHPRHSHRIEPGAGRGQAVVSARVLMKICRQLSSAKLSSCRSRVRSPLDTR